MTTEQEFNRYSIAYFDFEKARKFAVEAQKLLPNSITYEGLLFAAIVCYYRPFSPNEKTKNAPAISQLKIEEVLPLSDTEQGLHDKCKFLRNKALTHSESSLNPTCLAPKTGIISSEPFSLVNQPFDFDLFIQLIDKLIASCHNIRASYVHQQRVGRNHYCAE